MPYLCGVVAFRKRLIICEIREVNSSIYIFFKVFRHGIMVLIKNLLCLLERAVKSYEAII